MRTTVEQYAAEITAYQKPHPKFRATVLATLQPIVDAANAIRSMPGLYALNDAVGTQLDATGQWVGQTRYVTHPVAGPWFAFDDPERGWDMGVWRGPYDVSVGTYGLDDERYRRLLKARVHASRADGTIEYAQEVLTRYFEGSGVNAFMEDRCGTLVAAQFFAFDTVGRGWDEGEWEPLLFAFDEPGRGWDETRWAGAEEDDDLGRRLTLEWSIIVTGGAIPDPIDLAVLYNGLLPVKPMGVTLTTLVASEADAPMFGFDATNAYVDGFDVGVYGVRPEVLMD